VQQAVIAARGAGIEVLFFDQDAVNPAQGQITHQTGACDATTDNKYLGIQSGPQLIVGLDRILSD
jgi:ABC-type sugar transport system substrate-binding protein